MGFTSMDNLIEKMADRLFNKTGDDFLNTCHNIAINLASNLEGEEITKDKWLKKRYREEYPNIIVNSVYGDVIPSVY